MTFADDVVSGQQVLFTSLQEQVTNRRVIGRLKLQDSWACARDQDLYCNLWRCMKTAIVTARDAVSEENQGTINYYGTFGKP